MIRRVAFLALLAVGVAGGLGNLRAEVAFDPTGTIILGTITDDPDPVGIWLQYRPLGANVLNPSGHARTDGRPDLFYIVDSPDPIGKTYAVWAYNNGIDHDIAFSEWTGTAWSTTEFLTTGMDDDLDPRVYVDGDGTVHVVWWRASALESVWLSTRAAGASTWDTPVQVSEPLDKARRPSAATHLGDLRVVYERDSDEPGMVQDIVVATRQVNGSFTYEIVSSTVRADRLDAVIHAEKGMLWMDWKHAAGAFGCASFDSSVWSVMLPEPWVDESWVGVEGIRRVIRALVLN